MKKTMTALAVVLAAILAVEAAPAYAQERSTVRERMERGPRGERAPPQRAQPQQAQSQQAQSQPTQRPSREARADRRDSRRDDARGGGGGWRGAPRGAVPGAAVAPQAPEAPRAAEPRRRDDGVRYGQSGGDRRWDGRGRDDDRRDRGRDGRRGDERRDSDRRDGDRRDWGRRDNDRRDWDRRDNDRRDRNWGQHDRRDDRRDHRRWERGRYPSVYFSSNRYRNDWRAPRGFYVRSWSFGEFYPRSWFGSGYWITDPWRYDLPLPPPGFDWVRSGPDALLIDQFTGRIVQVVRDVFWW